METSKVKFTTIDEYIAAFPADQQPALEEMRKIIREAAPGAREVIGYGMPAFRTEEILVYFARAKNHIGFYPTPSGIATFQQELSAYKGAKGSVQFPLDQPLPKELIQKIVEFRANESSERALMKKKKNKV